MSSFADKTRSDGQFSKLAASSRDYTEDDLHAAVNKLESFTFKSAKKLSRQQLSENVAVIKDYAKQHGLAGDDLVKLVDLAASSKLNCASSNKLMLALIPRQTVPVTAALKAVSWICANVPPLSTQVYIMRWLVVVQPYIDDQATFHALYGMIFHFLHNETLCPHVCHLIYQMTQTVDVTLVRVTQLIKLQVKMGLPAHLTGLLSLYKRFCPHLVTLCLPRRQFYFKQTAADRLLKADIEKIQQRGVSTSSDVIDVTGKAMAAKDTFLNGKNTVHAKKRKRRDIIPDTSTSISTSTYRQKTRPFSLDHNVKVSLEEVKSFKSLLENIDRIAMPSRMASVLRNRYLQQVVCVDPDPVAIARFIYWLGETLQSVLSSEYEANDDTEELLDMLVNFTEFTQEGVPVCETFLVKYLSTWNGSLYRRYILKLLTRFRLYPFLYSAIWRPLQEQYVVASLEVKVEILACLTRMLVNFASTEYRRYQKTMEDQIEETASGEPTKGHHTIFFEEVEPFKVHQTFKEFTAFVDNLLILGMSIERDHSLLVNCALDFHEEVSCLLLRYNLPFVILPNRHLVSKMLTMSSVMPISRMGEIFVNLYHSYERMKKMSSVERHGFEDIGKLNAYILDYCDALWRFKAYVYERGDTSMFHQTIGISDALKDLPHPNQSLSINHHQGFLGYAWAFLKESQPKDKKVHPSLIKETKRVNYLEYLKRENCTGVYNFITQFVKDRYRMQSAVN